MSEYPTVALVGSAGVGKDTVAGILAEDFGYQRMAFADPLKELVYAIDDSVRAYVDEQGWERAKQADPYVRSRLVEIGEATRNHIDPYVWIHPVMDAWPRDDTPVVVSDVRNQSEIGVLMDKEAAFILISRDGCDEPTPRLPDGSSVINNDGTHEQLRDKVHRLMSAFSYRMATPGWWRPW